MALIHREVRVAPHKYPMTPDSALRIAAALSHLVQINMQLTTHPNTAEKPQEKSPKKHHLVQPSMELQRQNQHRKEVPRHR